MAHTCRGTISLVSAVIHTEDSCNFVISNGGTQTFHLRAGSEVERYVFVVILLFSIMIVLQAKVGDGIRISKSKSYKDP